MENTFVSLEETAPNTCMKKYAMEITIMLKNQFKYNIFN